MSKKKSRITLWRTLTQTAFVFLLNPYFLSFRNVCFPVLNCWGCPAAAFACPIGAMGNFFASGLFPFLVLGTLIFFGAILGRMLCGWVCPFGFLQDLLYKIKSPKLNLPPFFKYGKYLVLLIMVILIPLFFGIDLTPGKTKANDFFFCYLCPAGTLEATIPVTISNSLKPATPAPVQEAGSGETGSLAEESSGVTTTALSTSALYEVKEENIIIGFLKSPRIWILIGFLILFVFITRLFCRSLCPIGAIFALLNKLSIYKIGFDKEKCTECKLCDRVCPTDHSIYISSNSPECIRCLECQKKCPVQALENQYF
jgi:polyferredoxin